MDATTENTNEPNIDAQLVGTFAVVARADIRPSPTNHRKKFTGLEELGDSIAAKGMILPLIVRPSPPPAKKGPKLDPTPYELVAGERRWRASGLRHITHVPVIIRELSDVEVLEIQLVENVQRADVHPLEEALGFHDLMERHGYTVEKIVAKTGKTRSWVYSRLKLVDLAAEVREAFLDDLIGTQVALALARLTSAEHQLEALKVVLGDVGRAVDEMGIQAPRLSAEGESPYDGEPQPLTTKQALAYLERRFMLDLRSAKFPLDDGTLLPDVGDCTACVFRTGNQPDLFAGVTGEDKCTRPPCFEAKRSAWFDRQSAAAKARGLKVLSPKESEGVQLSRTESESYDKRFAMPGQLLGWEDGWKATGKAPTFEKLLGKDLAQVPRVLVQTASGDAVEVIDRAAALKLAKDKGKLKPPPKGARADNGEAEQRRKLEARQAVVETAVPRIASAVSSGFKADTVNGATGWWQWLATKILEQLNSNDIVAVCRALKLDAKRGSGGAYEAPLRAIKAEIDSEVATPSGLRYLIAVLVVGGANAAGGTWSVNFSDPFKDAAERWKVDLQAITKDVAQAQKKPAVKPAKKGGKS